MLGCTILVCLLGLMYLTETLNSAYAQSQAALTGIIMAVIILAILYVAAVLLSEVGILLSESSAAKARAQSRGNKKIGGSAEDSALFSKNSAKAAAAAAAGGSSGGVSPALLRSLSSAGGRSAATTSLVGSVGGGSSGSKDAIDTRVEQGMNPLFASAAAASGGSGAPGRDADAGNDPAVLSAKLRSVVTSSALPSESHWALIRDLYSRTAESLDASIAELSTAKRQVQELLKERADAEAGAPPLASRRSFGGPGANSFNSRSGGSTPSSSVSTRTPGSSSFAFAPTGLKPR